MKIFKYSVLFIIISLCFILHSEIVQNNLDTFSEDFYYIDVFVPNGQERQFISTINLASEKYNNGVFFSNKENHGIALTYIIIYASDEARDLLKSHYNIYNTTYKSLFSGSTKIIINDVEEFTDSFQDYRLFLTGDYKTSLSIRETLSKHFAPSYVKIQKNNSFHMLPILLWALAIVFILILLFLSNQYSKKEWFLRISLGERKFSVFLKEVLKDTFFLTTFLFATIFLLKGIYIGRNTIVSVIAIGIVAIINIFLHFTIFNADYKEVIYGANINSHTTSNCYLLKALIMIVATISISSNLFLISKNYESLKQYNMLNPIQNQKLIKIVSNSSNNVSPDKIQLIQETESLFFNVFFNQGKVTLSTKIPTNDNILVFANKNATPLINGKGVVREISNENSICVIIPDGSIITANIEEDINEYLNAFFNENLKENYNVINYKNASILCIDVNNSQYGSLGYETIKNPIIIVYNGSQIKDNGGHLSGVFNNFVFSITDDEIADFSEKYDLESKGIMIEQECISSRFGELKNLFLRKILLNSVVAFLLLFIDILMISVMVKIDYSVNAIELSLKRILGYTIYEKNRTLILLSSYAATIGIVTSVIASMMFNLTKWWIVAVTGLVLLCMEYILIVVNICRLERENTSQILKGGSL